MTSILPSQTASLAPGLPFGGSQIGALVPAANAAALSDDEQRTVDALSAKLATQSPPILLRWAYYDGLQRLSNLGISIPPQLAGVRTVVDWPRVCCDPLAMRAVLAGFRLPDSTDVDDELGEFWQANDMEAEFPLAVLDSLVAGRGYVIVGSPDEPGDAPLVTVESPLNLAGTWDARRKVLTAAYQAYSVDRVNYASLYLPDVTIEMRQDSGQKWIVENRDEHGFGEVPVVRLPNRARSSDREGRSEITPAVMNTTDSACRSLLGMEIAREVYSIPHLWIIGASESSFQRPDGTKKSALDMAMTKVLALERDANGDAPTIGQLQAFDPSVFTKIIDEHAQLMASYTGFPPSYFGQTTTANPASADAIRVSLDGLDRHGGRVQAQATSPARKIGQLMWRFAHPNDDLPEAVKRLQVDWIDAKTATPAATTDAITKQIAAGSVPATSDVTLARLSYTPLERKRLEQDRKLDPSTQLESELTSSIAGRQTRAGNALANVLEKAAAPDATAPVEPPSGQAGR